MKLRTLLSAGAVALVTSFTGAAFASDISYVATYAPPLANANIGFGPAATSDDVTYNNSGSPIALTGVGGTLSLNDAQVVSGASGVHAIPYGMNSSTPYVSVYSGGSAVFSFTAPVSQIAFDWGSIDSYNSLTVTTTNNSSTTIVGNNLCQCGGNQGYTGSDLVTITSGLGDIKSITLTSSGNSFEAGSFKVSSVPLPGTLPLFGGALVGIVALARRRAKKAA